jgi:nucleoside-diphosphate-sugar epimerase
METVLVTGGSGFLGSHVILQLLRAGYDVRTTVRSLNRESHVRALFNGAGVDPAGRLAFFAADLSTTRAGPTPSAAATSSSMSHPQFLPPRRNTKTS